MKITQKELSKIIQEEISIIRSENLAQVAAPDEKQPPEGAQEKNPTGAEPAKQQSLTGKTRQFFNLLRQDKAIPQSLVGAARQEISQMDPQMRSRVMAELAAFMGLGKADIKQTASTAASRM